MNEGPGDIPQLFEISNPYYSRLAEGGIVDPVFPGYGAGVGG